MTNNKQRVATHEAGHVIAAVQLGIPVIGATIEHGTPHFMRGRFVRSRDIAIEHLRLICLSGPAAEELFCLADRRRTRQSIVPRLQAVPGR
jgi:hypothetical protein